MNSVFQTNFEHLKEAVNTTTTAYTAPALECIEATKEALLCGNKILLCGNGGSASTASHITNDFVGHMANWNRKGYPAIALTADISVLTALTNDFGYDAVFSRQVETLGVKGDILWGFSTSGNSKNVILAVEACKKAGIKTVIFTCRSGGKLKDMADIWVPVNTDEPMLAEALHLFYIHSIAESIELELDPVR